ncbi:MAG: 2,3-bisphosphoglycerate-independent phosphoglycerate mutase [Candidatus Thermoplasmatota archaeon]
MDLELSKRLKKSSKSKIVFLVIDGLGGTQKDKNGKTELEEAYTPNMDSLASEGTCGMHIPVKPGITPGSGPGHLGIFGYDPLKYQVGRGVLSALGINFNLKENDIAARGNFCTLDKQGKVTDRRAGRIPTKKNKELCEILNQIKLKEKDIEIFVKPVKEYRLLLALRGKKLSPDVEDTDPQEIGKKPLDPEPTSKEGGETAEIVSKFLTKVENRLKNQKTANMLLLRGFSKKPDWPEINDVYGLKTAAIAAYPMYKGVSRLIGMDVLETGQTYEDEFDTLEKNWNKYDFFYIHMKKSDSAGEDGDFRRKVKEIEKVDKLIPRLLNLKPDVLVITGDHSTPSALKYHSWHSVPFLLWSKRCRRDRVESFGETECIEKGGLDRCLPAKNLMPLAMAHADRLEKFGA